LNLGDDPDDLEELADLQLSEASTLVSDLIDDPETLGSPSTLLGSPLVEHHPDPTSVHGDERFTHTSAPVEISMEGTREFESYSLAPIFATSSFFVLSFAGFIRTRSSTKSSMNIQAVTKNVDRSEIFIHNVRPE